MEGRRLQERFIAMTTADDRGAFSKSVLTGAISVMLGPTLREELQSPDFLSNAELQDLLQDVLPLGLLDDAHSLQLPVRQSHQGPP